MSTFQPNRINLDEVTIELSQTDKSFTQVNLRHAILDDKRDYSFCVDSLVCPLNKCPIFNYTGEMFRIERRNVGAIASLANDIEYQYPELDDIGGNVLDALGAVVLFPPVTTLGIFSVGLNLYDISALVEQLNNFCRGFNQAYTRKGLTAANFTAHGLDATWVAPINDASIAAHKLKLLPPRRPFGVQSWAGDDYNVLGPYEFIKFKLLPDYSLELMGSSHFWNNFVITFTRTGAEILGFSKSIHELPMPGGLFKNVLGTSKSVAARVITHEVSYGGVPALLYEDGVGNLLWNYGKMDRDASVLSEHSLAQSADQRLKVIVEAHLPFNSNIAVIDNIETTTRSICEVYFVKDNRSTLTFDATGSLLSTSTESNIYAGDYQFIRKSDQFKQWTRLSTSYEIRFLRFFLKIVYRTYNSIKDIWELKTQDLEIPNNRMWSMLLRFISDV